MLISRLVCFLFLVFAVATAPADEALVAAPQPPVKEPIAEKPAAEPASATAPKSDFSAAERIAHLRKTLEAEHARLKELEAEANDPKIHCVVVCK